MEVGKRLERELDEAMGRLRRAGLGVAVDEAADGLQRYTPHADPMDEMRICLDREITFATRSLLVERTRRLTAALARVRDGSYGVCDECGEAIAHARLRALPEVATCVACQDRLERLERLGTLPPSLDDVVGDLS